MKSKLFGQFDPKDEDNKQFLSDLKVACELSTDQRHAITDTLPHLLSLIKAKEKEEATDALQKQTGASQLLIGHVSDFAGFFLRQMLDDRLKDEPFTVWSSDLIELGVLNRDQESAFLALLQDLKERTLPTLSKVKKQRVYGSGVLPSLKSCGTTVELRGVFDKPYRWGTSLAEYKPVLEDVVPVISVHITLDSGAISEIGFQMTPDEADLLISEFSAARVNARILSERLLPSDKLMNA